MAQAEVDGIKREADIERESRIAVLVVVIFGAVFSLLALFIERSVSIGLSIATIFLSWLLIHTVFAIYYAHEFHSEAGAGTRGGGGGGLKFPGDPTPDYLDFSISPSWSEPRIRPPTRRSPRAPCAAL